MITPYVYSESGENKLFIQLLGRSQFKQQNRQGDKMRPTSIMGQREKANQTNPGIGTTSPSSLAHIKGNTIIEPNAPAAGNNTWQLFYDSAGVCQTKMGLNGTHFQIIGC